MDCLELKSQVTFFVGENGSVKSTFMEALACKVGSITIGSNSIQFDKTLHFRHRLKPDHFHTSKN